MKSIYAPILAVALIFSSTSPVQVTAEEIGTQAAPPSAREIVAAINARDEGQAMTRTLKMELVNARGKIRSREAQVFRLKEDTMRKTTINFTAPRSVKDMTFLTYDEVDPDAQDNQWLYLPAMKKTRRIPASNMNDSFLGTDFTYRDVKDEFKLDITAYRFKRLTWDTSSATTEVEGHVIDEEAARRVGHHSFHVTVDTISWLPTSITYFQKDGSKQKTISLFGIQQVQGIWTPTKIEAVNHLRNHRTIFHYSDINYEQSLPGKIFAVNRLGKSMRRR